MAELAEFPPNAEAVHRQLSEVAKASQGGALPPGIAVAVKTDEQVGSPEYPASESWVHS